MIDVWGVVGNGLWVLGLAVLLAAFSWAHWAASVEGVRFRAVLGRRAVQRVLYLGLVLFCAGLATTMGAWWKRVLWVVLAIAFGVQGWLAGQEVDGAGGGSDAR